MMSSNEQTGDVITFAQFEEGNLLTETLNDTESSDESDSKSLMMNKQDMENLDKKEKYDADHISTKRYMTIVTEIRPIRTLIKGEHVLQYAIALSKGNHDVNECQNLCKAWEKVYTRYLVRL